MCYPCPIYTSYICMLHAVIAIRKKLLLKINTLHAFLLFTYIFTNIFTLHASASTIITCRVVYFFDCVVVSGYIVVSVAVFPIGLVQLIPACCYCCGNGSGHRRSTSPDHPSQHYREHSLLACGLHVTYLCH